MNDDLLIRLARQQERVEDWRSEAEVWRLRVRRSGWGPRPPWLLSVWQRLIYRQPEHP